VNLHEILLVLLEISQKMITANELQVECRLSHFKSVCQRGALGKMNERINHAALQKSAAAVKGIFASTDVRMRRSIY
jgi:hypothetical protein